MYNYSENALKIFVTSFKIKTTIIHLINYINIGKNYKCCNFTYMLDENPFIIECFKVIGMPLSRIRLQNCS